MLIYILDIEQNFLRDLSNKADYALDSDLFNPQAIIYFSVYKRDNEYSILDLGGIEVSIMLAAKDHGIDLIPAYVTIMYPDV